MNDKNTIPFGDKKLLNSNLFNCIVSPEFILAAKKLADYVEAQDGEWDEIPELIENGAEIEDCILYWASIVNDSQDALADYIEQLDI